MNEQCRQFRERLSPYLEGDLEPATRQSVEAHLSQCSACSSELEALRNLLSELKEAPPVGVPPAFRERVWARIESSTLLERIRHAVLEPWYVKIPVGALATAAIVLLAVRVTGVTPARMKAPAMPTIDAFVAQNSVTSDDINRGRMAEADKRTASGEISREQWRKMAPTKEKIAAPPSGNSSNLATFEERSARLAQQKQLEQGIAGPLPAPEVPAAQPERARAPSEPTPATVVSGGGADRFVFGLKKEGDLRGSGFDVNGDRGDSGNERVSYYLLIRIRTSDVAAAEEALRQILTEIPVEEVKMPFPIRYEFRLEQERIELLLDRVKPLGTLEAQEVGSPEQPAATTRLIILEIIPSD